MARLVEYKDEYLPGVVSCLKRNFSWMNDYTDTAIIEWLDPIINYNWFSGHNPNPGIPYSKGMVLLDKVNNVVGFNGLILSKQIINEKEYICGNMSTTAIDPKYRIQVYSMFAEVHKVCDLVSSYTPIEVNQKIEKDLHHYKSIEKFGYKFLPIPVIRNGKIKIVFIKDSNEIGQKDLQQIYEDHKTYDVRCVCINSGEEVCYLFYRVMTMKFGFIKYRNTRVLYSSNPTLCGRYAKDIVWAIEKKERASLESDSRFFGGNEINYKFPYFKRKRVRLVKNFKDDRERFPYGLLYSEQSILKSRYDLHIQK